MNITMFDQPRSVTYEAKHAMSYLVGLRQCRLYGSESSGSNRSIGSGAGAPILRLVGSYAKQT